MMLWWMGEGEGTLGREEQGVTLVISFAEEPGEGARRGQGLQHAGGGQGLARWLPGGPGRADVGEGGGQQVGQGRKVLLQGPPVQLRPAGGWQGQQLDAGVRCGHLQASKLCISSCS